MVRAPPAAGDAVSAAPLPERLLVTGSLGRSRTWTHCTTTAASGTRAAPPSRCPPAPPSARPGSKGPVAPLPLTGGGERPPATPLPPPPRRTPPGGSCFSPGGPPGGGGGGGGGVVG